MRPSAIVHCLTALGALPLTGAQPVEPAPIPAAQFEQLHAMCKSQPGESRFWDLPWTIQLDEAIERGVAEGKPIFVWCGAGGAPVGVC